VGICEASSESLKGSTKPAQLQRRRPDPFAAVTTELREWFEAEPWRTSRELLERLQTEHPGVYPEGGCGHCSVA
jgi:hypothetical protein